MDNKKQLQIIKELREKAEELLNIATKIEDSIKPFNLTIKEALELAFSSTISVRGNGNTLAFVPENWHLNRNSLMMILDDFSFAFSGEINGKLLEIASDYGVKESELVREVKNFLRIKTNIEFGDMMKNTHDLKFKNQDGGLQLIRHTKINDISSAIIQKDTVLSNCLETVKFVFNTWKYNHLKNHLEESPVTEIFRAGGFDLLVSNVMGKSLVLNFTIQDSVMNKFTTKDFKEFVKTYTYNALQSNKEDILYYLNMMSGGDTVTLHF